jgi:predicted nucleic acid-binding protein
MMKKRVYVESSVISYPTARPSRILIKLAKQQQTWDWWESRHWWDLFISPIVMLEIQRGDQSAARKRVEAIIGLPLLAEVDEMGTLAEGLINDGLFPNKAYFDALHVACATLHGMDYLVTWNQTHLFNLDRIEALYLAIRERGHTPPVLVRPDYLLEAYHGS